MNNSNTSVGFYLFFKVGKVVIDLRIKKNNIVRKCAISQILNLKKNLHSYITIIHVKYI